MRLGLDIEPFGNFIDSWLGALGLDRHLDAIEERLGVLVASETREECRALLLAPIVEQVHALALRCLLHEFHEHRRAAGLPLDEGSSEALDRFTEELDDEATRTALLARYPVMNERARHLVDQRAAAIVEALDRLRSDRQVLVGAGFVDADADVLRVRSCGGDSHNGGRSVLAIDHSDGSTVLYKPRSLSSDKFVRSLFSTVDPFLIFDLKRCVPPSIDRGGYGWQRWVPVTAAGCADDVARYFYRYGALCALFGAIGTTDLHNENVIAAGDAPVVVDTETVLGLAVNGPVESLQDKLSACVTFSPAAALLLPSRHERNPVDALFAAVGVLERQRVNRAQPTLVGLGTDAMRLEWTPIELEPCDPNILRLGGEVVDPTAHRKTIVAGFTDAMRAVRSGVVGDALDVSTPFVIRYVLRATFVYGRFVDATRHPQYLSDEAFHDEMLARLAPLPYLPAAATDDVARFERRAVFEGDIPYVEGRSDERVIRFGGECREVMTDHPLDNARRGVELAASNSDEYHLALIEACLAEVADEHVDLLDGSVFAPLCRPAGTPGELAERTARLLTAMAVRHDGPGGPELGWVMATADGRATLSPGTSLGFHDMGGIVAFLRRIGGRVPDFEPAGTAAVAGLLALTELSGHAKVPDRHPLMLQPMSIFGGAASLALSLPSLPDPWLERCFERPTQPSSRQATVATSTRDLVSGPGGLVMLAGTDVRLRTQLGADRIDWLINAVTSDLGAAEIVEREWWDLAHGALGLYWALARAGNWLDRRELVDVAVRWLGERLDDGELPSKPAWCNGSAGLLLVLAEVAATSESDRLRRAVARPDLRRACWSVIDGSGPVDVSVCHGASGVVQSLLAAGWRLDDHELVAEAVELHERTLQAVARRGARTGHAGQVALPGYLLGWAGFGDTDLLVAAVHDGVPPTSVPVALSTWSDYLFQGGCYGAQRVQRIPVR